MACSCGGSCSNCRKHGGRVRRGPKKYNRGGVLRGPSHAQGGIPAVVGGREPVELEGGEYIIRESSVQKYGEGAMARINQGLVDPNKLRQLKKGGYVKRYQSGGGMNNPITQTNLRAAPGQFVYEHNDTPYVGPYHIHQDGTYMIGAGKMGVTHEIKPNEIIVSSTSRTSNVVRRQPKSRITSTQYKNGGRINRKNGQIKRKLQRGGSTRQSEWVYYGTNDAYYGHVIKEGNMWWTTKGGAIEGDRKQVEKRK